MKKRQLLYSNLFVVFLYNIIEKETHFLYVTYKKSQQFD